MRPARERLWKVHKHGAKLALVFEFGRAEQNLVDVERLLEVEGWMRVSSLSIFEARMVFFPLMNFFSGPRGHRDGSRAGRC